MKKITSFDQQTSDEIEVEEIKDLPTDEQAELIADRFSAVSQEYDKLKSEDIQILPFTSDQIPQFSETQVKDVLSNLDTSKSNVNGDIPAKVLKACAVELAKPVTDLINS